MLDAAQSCYSSTYWDTLAPINTPPMEHEINVAEELACAAFMVVAVIAFGIILALV